MLLPTTGNVLQVHIQEEVKKSFAKKSDGWGATSATAPAAQKTSELRGSLIEI